MTITMKTAKADETVYKRIGRFSITRELLFGDYEIVNKVLSNVVVLECIPRYNGIFEYIAMSPLFDEVEEGYECPRYLVQLNYAERTIEFVKGGYY